MGMVHETRKDLGGHITLFERHGIMDLVFEGGLHLVGGHITLSGRRGILNIDLRGLARHVAKQHVML